MEDKNKMTEEEKHQKAYNELKDIQHQYGFENIAKLREFYVRLGNVFKDFDPPEESTKGSEILNTLHDAFTFFSKIDDIEDSKIQEEYDSLEQKMRKDNVSPYVINAINLYYNSRINSEIEKIRKRIIKGERNLEEAINNYYINRWELKLKQWEDRYTKAIINTLNFAFNFQTYHTNWNDGE